MRNITQIWLGILLLGVLTNMSNYTVVAQNLSNRGTEFWLGYGNNVLFTSDNPPNAQQMALYFSTTQAATVRVRVNGTSWERVLNIPANSIDASILLPKTGADDCRLTGEGLFSRGVHISSNVPIAAWAHQYGNVLSGGTMLMPVNTFGYSYYSMNYEQEARFNEPTTWFFVVAPEDNTTIEITPSDTTQGGLIPGQTQRINLNRGEIYNVMGKTAPNQAGKDLTGSKVISVPGADGRCHPIGLFSGSNRFTVCAGDGGEVMIQQMFPANTWGAKYVTYHTINNLGSDLVTPFLNRYRVLVRNPATVVRRNGVPLTGLRRNVYYEFESTGGDVIEADQPIMVAQYAPSNNQCTGTNPSPTGDPEVFFLSPVEQGIDTVRFYNTRNNLITINYVQVTMPASAIGSLRINGTAVPANQYVTHPTAPDYVVAVRRLLGAAGQNTITANAPFTAIVYGWGTLESYGYNAGTLVNNLNLQGRYQNTLSILNQPDTFTCTKTPLLLTIQVAYRATRLDWLLSQVPGMAAPDTTVLNPVPIDSFTANGRSFYTYQFRPAYTFTDTGVYQIPVRYYHPGIDHCSQNELGYLEIPVRRGPPVDFAVQYSGCLADTARFTGQAGPWLYATGRYYWQFAAARYSDTSLTIAQRFTADSLQPVTFGTIAANGCVADTLKRIAVYPQPRAAFTATGPVCVGNAITLSSTSTIATGTIAQYQWLYGNGQGQNLSSASPFGYTYADTGTYTVRHLVRSAQGCLSDTAQANVRINPRPQAALQIIGPPCVDSLLQLRSTGNAQGNTLLTHYWSFTPGRDTTVSANIQLQVALPMALSNLTLRHAVSAGPGCSSDTISTSALQIFDNPRLTLAVDSPLLCPEASITINATPSMPVSNWAWNFGNQTTASTAGPHTLRYAAAGSYTISVRATTAQGCGSGLQQWPITIYPLPQIDAGPNLSMPAGASIRIEARSADTTLQFAWTPSQWLNNPSLLNPVASPITNTTFTLLATGPGNCQATDSMRIQVLTQLVIPNAFSPNADGINDQWIIQGLAAYEQCNLQIFDRYGRLVHQQRGYNQPWTGSTANGTPLPTGVYYYVLTLGNGSKPINGSISLLR